jgi:hypothetical protein
MSGEFGLTPPRTLDAGRLAGGIAAIVQGLLDELAGR